MSVPFTFTAPGLHVVEAEQQPRQRRLARAGMADHRHRAAGGNGKVDVEEDLPLRLVGEADVLEAHGAGAGGQRRGIRRVGDLAVLGLEGEHALDVGERLADLAVEHAEPVERDVELDQQAVHQHDVADGHRAVRHAGRRPPHDQRHRHGDDGGLADVEEGQRELALHLRRLPLLHLWS
jgi:hypothetical protein